MTDDLRNAPWPRAVPAAGPGVSDPPLLRAVDAAPTAVSRRAGRTVLLVGEPEDVAGLHVRAAAHPDDRHRAVGCCLPSPFTRSPGSRLPVLGDWDDVTDVVVRSGVDAVVLAPSRRMTDELVRRIVLDAGLAGAEVLLTSAVPAAGRGRVRLRRVWGLPLLRPVPPARFGRWAKAATDRMVAAGLLVLLLPVLLTAAVLVRAGSPGPVLSREVRLGRLGMPFEVRRFRTTTLGPGGRTPVGDLLRRWGLDEVPQLLNVARGEMALVGPRPPTPAELAHTAPDQRRLLLVRPGLTGLWQLDTDPTGGSERHGALRYIDEWSFRLDLRILASTARAAIRDRTRP